MGLTGKRYLLAFLASTETCPAAADELLSLNEVALNRPDIDVVAIIDGLSDKEASDVNRSLALSYPILSAAKALIDTKREVRGSALKVLLETGRRRPVFLDGTAPTGTERRAFRARIERIR